MRLPCGWFVDASHVLPRSPPRRAYKDGGVAADLDAVWLEYTGIVAILEVPTPRAPDAAIPSPVAISIVPPICHWRRGRSLRAMMEDHPYKSDTVDDCIAEADPQQREV
jgi:hypothetical protein